MTQDELDNSYIRIVEDKEGQRWLHFPDEPFTIKRDLACHHCGYNLAGLQSNHRCPECGAPIAISLAGNTLVISDPCWMKRILRGARLMTASPLVFGISVFLQLPVWLIPENSRRIPQLIVFGIILTALVASTCIAAYGIWLFTTRHAHLSLTRIKSIRPAIRFAAIAIPSTACAIIVDAFTNWGIGWHWILAIGSPFGVIGAVGAYAMCAYVAEIARATFDDETLGHTRLYRYGLTFGYACAAIAIVLSLFGGPGVTTYDVEIGIGFGVVAMFVLFIFCTLIYMLPHVLVKQLGYCVDASEWAWDQATLESQAEDESPRD